MSENDKWNDEAFQTIIELAQTMMQRTANENADGLRRICKRSDQPKIERLKKL